MLVVAMLCIGVSSSLAIGPRGLPRRLVWEGTLTDAQNLTGNLRIRARLVPESRVDDAHFRGRVRCRGTGCPMRRGSIYLFPRGYTPAYIGLSFFGGSRGPMNVYCVYVNETGRLPGLAVVGPYTCYDVSPHLAVQPVISEGILSLAARATGSR